MTDITREAVEARAALLRSDYAADGAAFDADMLIALLNERDQLNRELACQDALIKDHLATIMAKDNQIDAETFRAEKGEEMAQFYKDAFRKMEADFGVVCAERDEARKQTKVALKMLRERPTAPHPIDQMNNLERFLREDVDAEVRQLTADRDQLAEQLALREPSALEKDMQVIMAQNNALLANLAVAQNAATDAASSLAAAISLLRRGGKKAAPSDKMFEQMLLDYEAALERTRAALAQANKTEEV